MYKDECAIPFEIQMSNLLLMRKMFGKMSWYFMMNIEIEYYFSCRVSFGGFICFGFFVTTNASSFCFTHIYQLLFYLRGFSYYMCAYDVIFSFKFKIQTKILSLALICRWLMKFSLKVINEKRRVITIYIFLSHNKFYLFKYNTCNTWGMCVIIWLRRVRWILWQIRKKKNSAR